jgi:hypothetical protein
MRSARVCPRGQEVKGDRWNRGGNFYLYCIVKN